MTANHFAWLGALVLVISSFVLAFLYWKEGKHQECEHATLKALAGIILLNQYAKLVDEKNNR